MLVFSLQEAAFPLRALEDALRQADFPVSLSLGIAGEATQEQLDALDWETAFVRWNEPEVHDVYLIERDPIATDEEARQALEAATRMTHNRPDSADRLIVADHLRRVRTVYEIQVLPALLDDDDHMGWTALDVVLRCIALETDGVILAEGEGFFDADGEPLLIDEDESVE